MGHVDVPARDADNGSPSGGLALGERPGISDLPIRTPDQRLRVFVSSTLGELAPERQAARRAILGLRLTPVLFELGARPHPPRALYRAYLAQSDVFVGIYWQRYGWVAPGEQISGLEDEYHLAGGRPKLIYIKGPATERDDGLTALLARIQADDTASYQQFTATEELQELLENDLALLLTERFTSGARPVAAPAEQPGRRAYTLPAPRASFIDREQEAALARDLLLRDDAGLVTLTGPGGAGKTRLALHVATDLRAAFADGVAWVPLAAVRDPDLVAPSIGQALGVQEAAGTPVLAAIQQHVAEQQLLLALDNFEQVVAAAPVVAQLLEACPRLKVLATSRAPLHVRGERELPVPPLAGPDRRAPLEAGSLSRYAAVRLFIERALDVKPDFAVTNDTAPAVAEICARLDGLPLAIELAAARVKVLPPQALLARLGRRLPLLTSAARDVPARQQTLRDTIAWSYDLLEAPERRLFRQLAVFAGGCTLTAAAEVWPAAREPELDLLDGVGSLVDKSLLQARAGTSEEPRLAMLETIREYGLERLEESGEGAEARRAHAAFFLALAEQAEPHLNDSGREAWLERLDTEQDNLRAALAWSTTDAGAADTQGRLAGALAEFWTQRGHVAEGRARIEEALARADPTGRTVARAKLLLGAGVLAWTQGDHAAAQPRLEESLAIAREVADARLGAYALHRLGMAALMRGDVGGARERFEESLPQWRGVGNKAGEAFAVWSLAYAAHLAGDLAGAGAAYTRSLATYREQGDARGSAMALGSLAGLAADQGDAATARALHAEALPLARQAGDRFILAWLLGGVGAAALQAGDPRGARDRFAESLALWRDMGNQGGCAAGLAGLAGVAAAEGQAERAGRLFGAAAACFPPSGLLADGSDRGSFDRRVADARARLDPSAFETGWAAGQAVPVKAAIAEALGGA